MHNQNLHKSAIWILILSLFLVLFFNCSSPHRLNTHIEKKFSKGVNLFILFSGLPRIKENTIFHNSLSYLDLSNEYVDKFCFYSPRLIKSSTEIDSVDIKIEEKFTFTNYETHYIEGNKKIDIYFPDMKAIKQLSKSSNIVLIYQELTVVSAKVETDLYSRYVAEDGLPGTGVLKDAEVLYLLSAGVFSIWDINDDRLIDFGKFAINTPITNDLSKMWINTFNKIIKESIIKTSLIQ